jgi:hypothetical protein
MSQPFLFPAACCRSPRILPVFGRQNIREPLCYRPRTPSRFSTRIVDKVVKDHLDTPPRTAFTCLHQQMGDKLFGKIAM